MRSKWGHDAIGLSAAVYSDVTTTIAFYETAFGLKRTFIDPTGVYGERSTGGIALGFVAHTQAESLALGYAHTTPKRPPPAMEIGLITDDVAVGYVLVELCT